MPLLLVKFHISHISHYHLNHPHHIIEKSKKLHTFVVFPYYLHHMTPYFTLFHMTPSAFWGSSSPSGSTVLEGCPILARPMVALVQCQSQGPLWLPRTGAIGGLQPELRSTNSLTQQPIEVWSHLQDPSHWSTWSVIQQRKIFSSFLTQPHTELGLVMGVCVPPTMRRSERVQALCHIQQPKLVWVNRNYWKSFS